MHVEKLVVMPERLLKNLRANANKPLPKQFLRQHSMRESWNMDLDHTRQIGIKKSYRQLTKMQQSYKGLL